MARSAWVKPCLSLMVGCSWNCDVSRRQLFFCNSCETNGISCDRYVGSGIRQRRQEKTSLKVWSKVWCHFVNCSWKKSSKFLFFLVARKKRSYWSATEILENKLFSNESTGEQACPTSLAHKPNGNSGSYCSHMHFIRRFKEILQGQPCIR